MKIFGYTPAQIKKALITALGFVIGILTVVTQNSLVPEEYVPYALTVLGAATTALVFISKNAPKETVAVEGDPLV